jgi:hypothetical protein
MSSVAALVWNQLIALVYEHTSITGDTWQKIKSGTTTSAGGATGNTLIDTGGDSTVADAYNGRYFVKILSGTNKGEWRRITDDDGAGTLTFQITFTNQVASGVNYEIYLSPDPAVVCDGDTLSTTQFNDDVRDEADNFWVGYYAIPITGNLRGEIKQVTAFDTAGGASDGLFTVSAFSAAPAQGDVILLRQLVYISAPTLGSAQAYHPRPQQRTNFSKADGMTGARAGTVSFSVQAETSGALSGDGVLAGLPPVHSLLVGCGLVRDQDTTSTFGAGSTTTAMKIATASWENYTIGGMIIVNGESTFIDSMTDGAGAEDTLTCTPALSLAPASGDICYATNMYRPSTSGDSLYGCGIEIEIDGVLTHMTGCKGSFDLGGEEVIEMTFNMTIDHWYRQVDAAPYSPNSSYGTTEPVKAEERLCYLDTTKTNIAAFTSTPGTVVQPRPVQGSVGVNGKAGLQVTNYEPGATFREIILSGGDLDQELRWTARTAKEVQVIYATHERTIAVRLKSARLMELPNPEELNEMVAAPNVLEAQDGGTVADGGGATRKIPNWSIHLP